MRQHQRRSLAASSSGRLAVLLGSVLAILVVGTAAPAIALGSTGAITGTVTSAAGGAPLPGVTVSAQDQDGNTVGVDTSGADGTYTVTGLDSGVYRVEFTPSANQNVIDQYYSGKAGFGTADPVSVTDGATTAGIDASMVTAGSISGTVIDATTHAPVSGLTVEATGADASVCSGCLTAVTDASGSYTLPQLPPGTYWVEAEPGALGYQLFNYLPQWYNGRATGANADPVSVTAGSTASNIDFALLPGGQITGYVISASGTPLSGIDVVAIDSSGNQVTDSQTDANGNYDIMGLATATYKIEFSASAYGVDGYVTDYYKDAPDLAEAEGVPVTAGTATPGINATLLPASSGARITGSVTAAATGLAVSNVDVTVYDPAGNTVETTTTDANGAYQSNPLLSGSYRVGFATATGTLAFQYFNDKTSLSAADPVSLTSGATTANVDAALTTGGSMSGSVTDSVSHAGLPGATVELVDSGGKVLDSATTDAAGMYTMGGIPPGRYHVKFLPGEASLPGGSPYADQYYKDKLTLTRSDTMPVAAGANTANIDAALIPETSVIFPTAPPRSKPGRPTIAGGSLTGVANGRATLRFRLAAGDHGAPKLKSVRVNLPAGLSFMSKTFKRGLRVTGGGSYTARLSKGTLTIAVKSAASKVSLAMTSKAVDVSRALASSARRHKVASLKLRVSVIDASGTATSLTWTFRRPH